MVNHAKKAWTRAKEKKNKLRLKSIRAEQMLSYRSYKSFKPSSRQRLAGVASYNYFKKARETYEYLKLARELNAQYENEVKKFGGTQSLPASPIQALQEFSQSQSRSSQQTQRQQWSQHKALTRPASQRITKKYQNLIRRAPLQASQNLMSQGYPTSPLRYPIGRPPPVSTQTRAKQVAAFGASLSGPISAAERRRDTFSASDLAKHGIGTPQPVSKPQVLGHSVTRMNRDVLFRGKSGMMGVRVPQTTQMKYGTLPRPSVRIPRPSEVAAKNKYSRDSMAVARFNRQESKLSQETAAFNRANLATPEVNPWAKPLREDYSSFLEYLKAIALWSKRTKIQ